VSNYLLKAHLRYYSERSLAAARRGSGPTRASTSVGQSVPSTDSRYSGACTPPYKVQVNATPVAPRPRIASSPPSSGGGNMRSVSLPGCDGCASIGSPADISRSTELVAEGFLRLSFRTPRAHIARAQRSLISGTLGCGVTACRSTVPGSCSS